MLSQIVHVYINSHIICVNGAFIVNTLGEIDILSSYDGKGGMICAMIPVNGHTPPFPVETSKKTYETLTCSFTRTID